MKGKKSLYLVIKRVKSPYKSSNEQLILYNSARTQPDDIGLHKRVNAKQSDLERQNYTRRDGAASKAEVWGRRSSLPAPF